MDIIESAVKDTATLREELDSCIQKLERLEDKIEYIGLEYRDAEQESKDIMACINQHFSKSEVNRLRVAYEKLQESREEHQSNGLSDQEFNRLLAILHENETGYYMEDMAAKPAVV